VDEVIIGAPYSITKEVLESVGQVSLVCHGAAPSPPDVDGRDPYEVTLPTFRRTTLTKSLCSFPRVWEFMKSSSLIKLTSPLIQLSTELLRTENCKLISYFVCDYTFDRLIGLHSYEARNKRKLEKVNLYVCVFLQRAYMPTQSPLGRERSRIGRAGTQEKIESTRIAWYIDKLNKNTTNNYCLLLMMRDA
jgi:ethanolamine-phosphate cytidylyltransferase